MNVRKPPPESLERPAMTMKHLGPKSLVAVLAALMLAAPSHAILPIQHWTSPSGARVLFVESRSLPMLDVSVDFPAGSGHDTPATAGRARLAQQLLRLGAGEWSEDAVAQRIADVGAQLGGRFDADRAGVSLRTLSSEREREQALAVLADVVQRPRFSQEVLEREKTRLIMSIKDADTKPDVIAARTFRRLVFREHPYAMRGSGEVETLSRVTRTDVVGFYREHYIADRAVVAIMGDVSRAQAERIAEQLTAALPRKNERADHADTLAPLAQAQRQVVPHPASQAHILVGAPGIRRDDPDYFALFVGNYILGGGGFASRLNEEVRQKRGLAYSVYSYFAPMLRAGHFQIGLQTRGDQAQAALDVVMQTLRSFVEQGPSEQELAEAKSNLIGGFPLRIDTNRKIHEYLAVIGFYRLPLTYLDDFVSNIERVSAADVRAAFRRHVHPDRLVTVMVGGGMGTASGQ